MWLECKIHSINLVINSLSVTKMWLGKDYSQKYLKRLHKWRANPFPLILLEVLSLSLLLLFSIHFTFPPTNEMHIVCTFRPIPHHSWLRMLIMFKRLFVYEMISISETFLCPPVSEAELWVSEYDFANDNNLSSVRIVSESQSCSFVCQFVSHSVFYLDLWGVIL